MVPMGIDQEQVLLQIQRLEEGLGSIKELSKGKLDSLRRAALERQLHIAVEEAINIGNHLVSGLKLPRADSYREIFQVLEKQNILSPALSKELQQFAVFRNRLVHLYWKISEKEFAEQLKKIGMLRDFILVVTRFLRKKKLL
ncbi:MAG TPA: HepT-like ribonuclease domain-containing protein [Candidatus Nanoarchaeia archaeon]|nr:HepT-like ribonuclease domain-containing protein [Candidatus Nanoarchaeia archaeon]